MSEFEFKAHGDITLKELRKISKDYDVVRSAHLGNVGLYNLAGAAQIGERKRGKTPGVTLLLSDRNVVGVDKNYHPGAVIFGGKAEHVSILHEGKLSAFTPLKPEDKAKLAGFLKISESQIPDTLAGLHYRTIKKAYAKHGGQVLTYSEYLLKHRRVFKTILSTWVKAGKFDLFSRVILPNGTTARLDTNRQNADSLVYKNEFGNVVAIVNKTDLVDEAVEANENLARAITTGTMPIQRKGATHLGILLDMRGTAALDALIQAYKGHLGRAKFDPEKVRAFHLSGPDYIKYGSKPDFVSEVSELVKLAGKGPMFPKTIEFHLLPQTHLNVAGDSKTVKVLGTIIEKWKTLKKLEAEKREKMSTVAVGVDKTKLIEHYAAVIGAAQNEIREMAKPLVSYLSTQSAVLGLNRVTVYDVVHDGYNVRLPHNVGDLKLSELSKLREFLEKGIKHG